MIEQMFKSIQFSMKILWEKNGNQAANFDLIEIQFLGKSVDL